MEQDTILLLEYLHNKSSRLAKAIHPGTWENVDVPELVRLLKEREKIKVYPMKSSTQRMRPSPLIISSNATPRTNKLRATELEEDFNEPNMLTLTTRSQMSPTQKTPSPITFANELQIGNVPLSPSLAALDCTAQPSQFATLRLPIVRDMSARIMAASPSGPETFQEDFTLRAVKDLKLSSMLPSIQLRSELALEHLLLASGAVLVPEAVSSNNKSARAYPERDILPGMNTGDIINVINVLRRSIMLTSEKITAFGQILRYFIETEYVGNSLPQINTADTTDFNNSFELAKNIHYSPQCACSLTSFYLVMCNIYRKLGGDLKQVTSQFEKPSNNVIAAYNRFKRTLSESGPNVPKAESFCIEDSNLLQDDCFVPPTRYDWVELISSTKTKKTDKDANVVTENWCEYRYPIASCIIRHCAVLVSSLFGIKQGLILKNIEKNIQPLIDPFFELVFNDYMRMIDELLVPVDVTFGFVFSPSDYVKKIIAEDKKNEKRQSFKIKDDMTVPQIRELLLSVLINSAKLFRLIELFAPMDRSYIIPNSDYNMIAVTPNVAIDLLFYTYSFLRDDKSYVYDLNKHFNTITSIFKQTYMLDDGFGELLLASVASSSFYTEWNRLEDKDFEVMKERSKNWVDDLRISANYSILAWNKFRHSNTQTNDFASPDAFSLEMSDEEDLSFNKENGVSSKALKSAILDKILGFTKPFLKDIRNKLPNGEDMIDVLLQTFVINKMMALNKYKMVTILNKSRLQFEPESMLTPTTEARLYEDKNLKSLRDDQIPQSFPRDIISILKDIVKKAGTKIVRKNTHQLKKYFNYPDCVPQEELIKHLPADDRNNLIIEEGVIYYADETHKVPLANKYTGQQISVAQKETLLDMTEAAFDTIMTDIESQNDVFMPKFSRYFIPYREEIEFIDNTDIPISSFSVYIGAVIEQLNNFYINYLLSWDKHIELNHIKRIGTIINRMCSSLTKCLKSAHVFGLRIYDLFFSEDTDVDALDSMLSPMSPLSPSTKIDKKSSNISQTLRSIFPGSGKHIHRRVVNKEIQNLILSDINDLQFAMDYPRKSVIRMARNLGIKYPGELCENLIIIFLKECRKRIANNLDELVKREYPKVSPAIDLQKINIDYHFRTPGLEEENLMGTITKFKDTMDIRYASNIVVDYIGMLNGILEEITGVSSGTIPESWGKTDSIPLTSKTCMTIVSFYNTQFTDLIKHLAKLNRTTIKKAPPLAPLFSTKSLKFTLKPLKEAGVSTPKEQTLKKFMKKVKKLKEGKEDALRKEIEETCKSLTPEQINILSNSYDFTLPRFSPKPEFDRLPAEAVEFLPFPEKLGKDTDIFSFSIRTHVHKELDILKKVVAALLRLNSYQTLEWNVLRFKGTLTEMARRIVLLERQVDSITCPENQVQSNEKDNLMAIDSMFLVTRDLLGKQRGELISSLTSHVIFTDMKFMFQNLYFERPADCTFDNYMKFTLLHILQVTARTVYPNLINTIARSFLFDLSTAMSVVILDTGRRSRVFTKESYDLLYKDFVMIKNVFGGANNEGPVPASFIESNMLPYTQAVKYCQPKYIERYKQLVISNKELTSFYREVENPATLSSTHKYLRILNAYRYTDEGIRSFMQDVKRRATNAMFSSENK